MIAFTIAAIDIPENDPNRQKLEEAFANKGVMGILGDDWGRQQATEVLHTLAANPGAGGVAAAGAGMGMGMAPGNVHSYATAGSCSATACTDGTVRTFSAAGSCR